MLVATRDSRLGVRAQAVWALSNFSHSLSREGGRAGGEEEGQEGGQEGGREGRRVDVPAICAAALEVLRMQPGQEKTASSALRAIG